ncbi:triple tyrosine motif-containing protein [Reichenbachiella ulvae]|uniref:Two component regulator three y domain-containing protein n=1 Tax=Reichenbachiella ulvae TaxID=2980104 RepID=A0ABT3D0C6_9BACT|nr:triple tyrosine motif-containing protein [Reichenbachiella ulvae]MCV9389190.1 two component regulator three y domain-containing protein [Reichenbachiella ulvae]
MTRKTTSIVLGLIFLLSLFDTFTITARNYKGIPFIRTFLPREYNAGMQNHTLTQDQRGIIYIGNNYGLLEYDGSSWRLYPVINGTKVRAVSQHPNGRIYIGAQGQFGYYFPDKKGELTYHSLSDMLPESQGNIAEVWNCFVRGDDVYFLTEREIFLYNGTDVKRIASDLAIKSSFMVRNQLYVQLEEQGLIFVERNHIIPVFGSQKLNDKLIIGLIPYSNDRLIAFTQSNGVYIYNNNQFKEWEVSANSYLKNLTLRTSTLLSNHQIVLGTSNNGIVFIDTDGQITDELNKDRGFNNKEVFRIIEDRYGNLWVGQNNGLAKIEYSSPFTYINEQYGVEGAGYCSYADQSGLFLGTNSGLFFLSKEGGNGRKMKKLEEGQVYSIQSLEDKILLGHTQGATLLDPKHSMKPQIMSNVLGAWDFIIPRNHPELLLEGSYLGLQVYKKNGDSWEGSGLLEGLRESTRVFKEDMDGSIWMSHGYKGVFRIYPSKHYDQVDSVKFYGTDEGFSTTHLINLFSINNEYLFCSEQGIYQYDKKNDQFELSTYFTEIFGDSIHIREMAQAPNGDIYFISGDSTGMIRKGKFESHSTYTKIFNKIHGRLNDDLENISILDYDNIMFGAHEGFIHYNPSKASNLLKPINVMIRRVISTNNKRTVFSGNFVKNGEIIQKQPSSSIPVFPYEENSLLFQFSSTFSDDDQKTQFSYYLKGNDSDWSLWSQNTEKEYTNLREGSYELQVKAKNIYNIESPIASYKFSVTAPWYRTNLAFSLYFLGMIGTVLAIVFRQSVRHKKEKKVLTLNQKRELIKKDNELEEQTQKSKAEIMKLKNEKLEFEINTKNKELASSTMNLIDKNQLLSGLKNDIQQILSQDKKSGNTKALKDMMKKIDKSITHDEEWEHFQQYFDQVHGDFTQRLRNKYKNLTPQEVKLSNYLRMNLSTKEIAQLMNITNRGVEIARYRLRKKLDLQREINLTEFIGRF